MANETVLFKRGDSATITSTPVTDGQILFDTSGNGKMYLDNGTDRLEMGGAITVDASLSKTSTNAIQNKAVTGNILNSLAEVSAATQQNTIAGALALKEVNDSLGGFSPVIDDTGKIIFGKLISNIEILDVKDSSGRHVFENTGEARTPSFIIFAVPEDVHLLIRKAMYLTKVSAELIPVPNTEVITEEDTVEVSSATIKEFVLSKTQLLNEDLLSASTDTE